GPDEGLVVEARRRQPAADDVGCPHHVELERGPRVHVPDVHARSHRLGAGGYAGPPIPLDQAIGAIAGAAEQSARAVVLEGAGKDPSPRRMECRADRVALVPLHLLAVELEGDRTGAVDPFVCAGGKPVAHSGSPTQLTSFVVVSRSATNHV